MLAEHRLASGSCGDEDFVFASETGGPMHHRNVVRRGLDKATATAGLPHLRWHDLRHLAASALIEQSDGDADHVSRVLGHSSASITQAAYAHEFEKVKRADRMRDRMEQAYGAMLPVIEHRGVYASRHTFAASSIAAGVPLFYLSRIMGTSVAQIDATYGHLRDDSEEYLRGPSTTTTPL